MCLSFQAEAAGLGLAIMKSTIANGGLGLYTTRAFKKGERLATYWGDMKLMTAQQKEEYESVRLICTYHYYREALSGGKVGAYTDGSIGSCATYVNDPAGTPSGKANCIMENKLESVVAKPSPADDWEFTFLLASKAIAKGEEVFFSYGFDVQGGGGDEVEEGKEGEGCEVSQDGEEVNVGEEVASSEVVRVVAS
jgi:hypothetical protein